MRKRARGQEVKGKKVKEPLKSRVYLFCEGCTERIYLSHFENKAYNVKIVPVDTGHTDAIGIVRFAKEYIGDDLLELEYGDKGYCVFDSDPASNPRIEEAFSLLKGVREKGLDCIFSNPCFEVWFALHFGNAPYGLTAAQMKHFVKRLIKTDIQDYSETTEIYAYLEDKQRDAYERAKRLHASQEKVHDRIYSHECNPYTDMFRFLEYMWELKERNSRHV